MSKYWANCQLTVQVKGPSTAFQVLLDKPYAVIGSGPQCDVILEGDEIPSRCFCVVATPEFLWGVSLLPGSTKTSRRFRPVDGERGIRVGRFRLNVETPQDDDARLNLDLARASTGQHVDRTEDCRLFWSVDGRKKFARLTPARPFLMGRCFPSQLTVKQKTLSSVHCLVYLNETKNDQQLWVVDLGSTNGISKKGKPQSTISLLPGEGFYAGSAKLRFANLSANENQANDKPSNDKQANDKQAYDKSNASLNESRSTISKEPQPAKDDFDTSRDVPNTKSLEDDALASRLVEIQRRESACEQELEVLQSRRTQLESEFANQLQKLAQRDTQLSASAAELAAFAERTQRDFDRRDQELRRLIVQTTNRQAEDWSEILDAQQTLHRKSGEIDAAASATQRDLDRREADLRQLTQETFADFESRRENLHAERKDWNQERRRIQKLIDDDRLRLGEERTAFEVERDALDRRHEELVAAVKQQNLAVKKQVTEFRQEREKFVGYRIRTQRDLGQRDEQLIQRQQGLDQREQELQRLEARLKKEQQEFIDRQRRYIEPARNDSDRANVGRFRVSGRAKTFESTEQLLGSADFTDILEQAIEDDAGFE